MDSCFPFLGEGIVQRNIEGIAPFLNTRFPEKVVLKSDALKCSEQTFVLLEILRTIVLFYHYGNKEYISNVVK